MMPDELDEILRSDETIEASPGFVSAVMRATYRESTELPPLPFPWLPFWPTGWLPLPWLPFPPLPFP